MLRTATPRRAFVAILTVGLLATTVPAASAVPPSTPSFGSDIDAYARYDGQSQCIQSEQPGVAAFRDLVMGSYPNTGRGNIVRACGTGGTSEHKEGRAWDWMLDANNATQRAQADELLSWLLATDEHGNAHARARRFGIMYIVWNRQVWSAYRPTQGWRPYTGAHPHTDHVHFSFSRAGAAKKTTFWTASARVATAPPPPLPGPFPDVDQSSSHHDAVAWLLDEGITAGTRSGTFRPGSVVTRAQMAAFLWRYMGEPTGSPAHGFSDVPADGRHDAAIRWLAASGITRGVDDEQFAPGAAVTRAQMAAFLWRLAGQQDAGIAHGFDDVASGSDLEVPAAWLREHEITNGVSADRFGGSQSVTRGQMAAFLHRLAGAEAAWSVEAPSTARF